MVRASVVIKVALNNTSDRHSIETVVHRRLTVTRILSSELDEQRFCGVHVVICRVC